jgi:predicted transcriptional regulator
MISAMPIIPNPTDAELAILQQLWRIGPATVRQVFEALVREGSSVGYTTILKLMQIMTAKGLVKRDQRQRTHIYRAAVDASQTRRRLVTDLVRRAFDNSAQQLVLHALSTRKASKAELREIRKLIEEIERETP